MNVNLENEIYLELETAQDQTRYKNSTYLIVSKIAYLIGYSDEVMISEKVPVQMREVFAELEKNKNARIIRNLCIIRYRIERNFAKIQHLMKYELKNLDTMPDYIPPKAAKQLWKDDIRLQKANYLPEKYVLDINKMLKERIDTVKDLFPIWLNWDYIRELFLMPGGHTIEGIRAVHLEYHANLKRYPYGVYINWHFGNDDGYILYNDKKFVSMLYEKNQDYFMDISRVSDASDVTKFGIYEFIEASSKGVVLVVDCENSDPYKLYATLKNLAQDQIGKVKKIILYDDVNASTAWSILDEFTTLKVERMLIQRLKENKSLTDMTLAVGVCKEFYGGIADSFVLLSSDSDYWALISMLPEARFLVMVEQNKVSYDMCKAMEAAGIFYCFIDDFYTGNSDEIRMKAVLSELQAKLDEQVNFNIRTLMKEVFWATRVEMATREERQFYDRYVKKMKIVVDVDGNVSLKLEN